LIASLHLMDYDIKQHFEEVEINVLVQLGVTVHWHTEFKVSYKKIRMRDRSKCIVVGALCVENLLREMAIS